MIIWELAGRTKIASTHESWRRTNNYHFTKLIFTNNYIIPNYNINNLSLYMRIRVVLTPHQENFSMSQMESITETHNQ